jgi:hypothetical protein
MAEDFPGRTKWRRPLKKAGASARDAAFFGCKRRLEYVMKISSQILL